MFELVHLPQPDGRMFEVARRAPGVRLIIADRAKQKILLTKEFRRELDAWDYRLPGGKVFDTLDAYEAFRASNKDILPVAAAKAQEEAAQEAGVVVETPVFYKKSTLGATVEWDLYVFEADSWRMHEAGPALEEGELVESADWHDFAAAERMVIEGVMQEERIALILLQWIRQANAH